MNEFSNKRRIRLMWLFLAAITLAMYARTALFGFVNYDDTDYVLDNPHVSSGLKLANLIWALRESYAANWQPLTWASHMLDCQLFGPTPGFPHLINALLHAANSVLVFLVFFRMTGLAWRSWFVAALFAFHPLHVESVAWIAERKDVLSSFFLLLTLFAYVCYAETATLPSKEVPRDRMLWYVGALVFYTLGLLSKPMIVTLPCILILIDYWPLKRFQNAAQSLRASHLPDALPKNSQTVSLQKLIIEKAPFFVMALGSCLVTFFAQRNAGAVASLNTDPLSNRLENAALSYFRYLGKMFWPEPLFIPYVPEVDQNPGWALVAGGCLLLVTTLALVLKRRFSYFLVGWFWFLGTLAPVIGLVQVGSQTMADRYTYVPLLGIFFLLTWGCADLLRRWRVPTPVMFGSATAVLGICAVLTLHQIGYWRNGEILFLHSVKADPTNLPAIMCLAWTYATDPDPRIRNGAKALDIAKACVEATSRKEPGYLDTLSAAYAEMGQFSLALEVAGEALLLPSARAQPYFFSQVEDHIAHYKAGRAVRSK